MSGVGNLYPNWLGSASISIPSNSLTTTVTVGGNTYATTVNAVPQILLSTLSTTILNTANPSEVFSYTVPAAGWYETKYNGAANHTAASNWNVMTQLVWYAKVNNTPQASTETLIEPQYACGDSVTEQIHMPGGGIFYAPAGALVEWTTDANTLGPAITTGFASGFNYITLQKIG